jgi:CHAT domain-containing protein/tetratricopeptide (TPR) repeat protein
MQSQMNVLIESSRLAVSAGGHLINAYNATRAGDIQEAAREYGKFENDQTRVVELAGKPDDQKTVAGTLINGLFMYADVLDALGRREDAGKKRDKAVSLSRKYMDAAGDAEAERSRAASLLAQARFNEALVSLYTARGYYSSQGNVLKMARTSIDLADLLQWLGDYSRAKDAIDYAAEACEKISLSSGLQGIVDLVEKERLATEIPYYRGLVAKFVGDYDAAERHFRAVLPKYQALGVDAAIQYQIASVLIRKGELQRGYKIASEIEPVMRASGMMRPKLAGLLNLQAEALIKFGKTKEAVGRLEEGLRDLENYYDPDLRWRLEWHYASALNTLDRVEESLLAYSRAVETVALLRRAPLGYRLDSLYLKDKMDLFHEAIGAAAARGMPRQCASFMETVKARSLSAVLSIPRRDAASSDPNSKKFHNLCERLDAIEYQGFRDSWTPELRKEQHRLLGERANLLEQLRFSDPRWHTLTQTAPLDMSAIVAGLHARNQAVLDLFVAGTTVHCVLISPDVEITGILPLSDEVRSNIREYTRNLAETQPNPLLFDLSDRLSVQADNLVPDRLLLEAVKHDTIIIIPHGELHLLPWAGLTFRGKRLFEYCAVGVLPNLTSMIPMAADPSTSPVVALLGPPDYAEFPSLPPLPAAIEEIEEIRKIYSGYGGLINQPLVAALATEAAFWKLAEDSKGKAAILHMSCHGGTEPAEPMNSGLYMKNGKVDAAEISASQLPYAEVVMSACSTGWRPSTVAGVEILGDDILGLPGAFMEAGVRNVIVSIPLAEERAAADLMIEYHKSRAAGTPPLHALRQAQLAMLGNRKHMPCLWVGFALYGCR